MGYFYDKYGGGQQPTPTPVVAPTPVATPNMSFENPDVLAARKPKPNVYNLGALGFINKVGSTIGKGAEKVVNFAGEIGKTFGRTGVTVGKTAESVAGLIAYGAAVAKGDRALAQRILNENPAAETKLKQMLHENKVNLPLFGETKAYAPPEDVKGMGQYIGAGAEIGSWIAPLGAAALNVSTKTVAKAAPSVVRLGRMANAVNKAKTGFKAGLKVGGPTFAAMQGGHEAQREESTGKSIALNTLGGYVTGVGFQTVAGFVGGVIAKQPKGVQAGVGAFERAMKTSGGAQASKETLAQMKAGLAYTPHNQQLSKPFVGSILTDAQAQLGGESVKASIKSDATRKALNAGLEKLKGGNYRNLAELAAAIDDVAKAAPMEVRDLLVRQGFASLPSMLLDKQMGATAANQMFTKAVVATPKPPTIRLRPKAKTDVVATVKKGADPLYAEARKYKSADEFLGSIVQSKTNPQTKALLTTVNPKELRGGITNPGASNASKKTFTAGRKVTEPIDVIYNLDTKKYTLEDGEHRLQQALINGDKKIPAHVTYIGGEGAKQTQPLVDLSKAQLTDIWKKAQQVTPPTTTATRFTTGSAKRVIESIRKNGGITYGTINKKDFGGTKNISVSIYPERSFVTKSPKGVTPEVLIKFIKKNADLLKRPGHTIGGWIDDKGKLYLDVSVVIPKTKGSAAVKLGKEFNQISVFDLEKFAEIKTGGTGKTVANLRPIADRVKLVESIIAPKNRQKLPLGQSSSRLRQTLQSGSKSRTLSSQTTRIGKSDTYSKPLSPNEKTVNTAKGILKGGKPRERGFVTTVKMSENTPTRLKKVVSGEYIPKQNSELRAVARDLIRRDPAAAEQLAINPQNDTHVQIGNELLAHYAKTGETAKAKALAKSMAESGTEFGRAVQAFAGYNKTTPEGALRFAQSKVNEYNKLNPGKALELSDRQIQSLFTRAKNVQKLAEGRRRNIATQDLIDDINNLIPSSFTDKTITVWKAGLLTSLRTHERNLLGNLIHSITETAKDVPAVINDMILRARTGQRSITLAAGSGKYGKKGFGIAKDMLYKGFDPEKTIEKYDFRHITWDNTPWQQLLKKGTNAVFRTLGAEDKVFYNHAFGRSLYDQAGAAAMNAGKKGNRAFIEQLVAKPSQQMLDTATKEAQRAVFQNTTMAKEVIAAVKQSMSRSEAGKFVSEFFVPFTGVPSSIANEIVAYSPVGLLNGVAKSARILLGSGTTNIGMQRAVSQQVGRGVIGTGILGAGAYLAKRGLMTGEPKDEAERRQWELEGRTKNSILIGGKWRSINSVGAQTIILLAGAEWSRQNKTKDNPFTEKVLNTAGYLAKAFTNQTFLAGVQQPLSVITDPQQNKPVRYIGNLIASWIPNIIKDAARSVDINERETNGLFDQLTASIPWARNTLLPRRDVLGKEMPNEQKGVASFVDLFRSKTPSNDPLVLEFARLYNAGESATPSKIEPNQKYLGATIKLNPKLLDSLEKESGGQLRVLLTAMINTEQYKAADDKTKKKYIDTVVDVVRRIIKQKHLLPILREKINADEEIRNVFKE